MNQKAQFMEKLTAWSCWYFSYGAFSQELA